MKHIRILTVFTFAALALSACSQNGRLEDSRASNDVGEGVDGIVDGPADEEVPSHPVLVPAKPDHENWASDLRKVINEVPHAVGSGIGQAEPQNGSPDLPTAINGQVDYELSAVGKPEAVKALPNISVPSQDITCPYVTSMEYVGYDADLGISGVAKVRITFSEAIEYNYSYVDAYKVVVNGVEVSAVNVDDESLAKKVVHFPIPKGQTYLFIANASGIQDMQGNAGVGVYQQSINIH